MHGFKIRLRFDFYKVFKETKSETAAEQIETGRESQNETVRKKISVKTGFTNDHRFNECEIDWEQAERFGITKEGLKFNNTLETLLGRAIGNNVPYLQRVGVEPATGAMQNCRCFERKTEASNSISIHSAGP